MFLYHTDLLSGTGASIHASRGCERLLWQRYEEAPGPWLVDILSISMVLLTNGKILLYAPEKKGG